MAQFWQIDPREAYAQNRPQILVTWIPISALVLLIVQILKVILQVLAEGKAYFESFANLTDVFAYVLVIIC